MSTAPDTTLLPALVLLQPHGLKGAIKAKCLLDDPNHIPLKTALPTASGTQLTISKIQQGAKGLLIIHLLESTTPESAEALRGVQILLPRDLLPELEEDELYAADLIGQPLFLEDGTPAGTVTGLQETPAHTLLVLKMADDKEALIPFDGEFLIMAEDGSFFLSELGILLLAV